MAPSEVNAPEWHANNIELPVLNTPTPPPEPIPPPQEPKPTFWSWDTGPLDNAVSQYPINTLTQPLYQGGVSYTEGILPETESYLIPLKAKNSAPAKGKKGKKAIKPASKKAKPSTSSSSSKKKGAPKSTKKATKSKPKPKSKTTAPKKHKNHHKKR
jgi:hypothetical protein